MHYLCWSLAWSLWAQCFRLDWMMLDRGGGDIGVLNPPGIRHVRMPSRTSTPAKSPCILDICTYAYIYTYIYSHTLLYSIYRRNSDTFLGKQSPKRHTHNYNTILFYANCCWLCRRWRRTPQRIHAHVIYMLMHIANHQHSQQSQWLFAYVCVCASVRLRVCVFRVCALCCAYVYTFAKYAHISLAFAATSVCAE